MSFLALEEPGLLSGVLLLAHLVSEFSEPFECQPLNFERRRQIEIEHVIGLRRPAFRQRQRIAFLSAGNAFLQDRDQVDCVFGLCGS
jgi:hypothetical protein